MRFFGLRARLSSASAAREPKVAIKEAVEAHGPECSTRARHRVKLMAARAESQRRCLATRNERTLLNPAMTHQLASERVQ